MFSNNDGFISNAKMQAVLIIIFFFVVSNSFGLFYNTHTKIGIIIGEFKTVTFQKNSYQIINYLGIPYAQDPSGENRFRKPLPLERFKQPYNATLFRPACLQAGFGQTQQVTSEDCLYLNIYAPAGTTSDSGRRYPVLIFIHGGKFLTGASNDYAPDVLVAVNDVIVVTVNYRLSVFGFLSSGEWNAPGNYGLWDQHLAIKWVRHNIIAFGGNTKRITLFGQSAGSASALYQALYPGNRGLFQRIIAISGSALSPWALHKPNAEQFAIEVGCLASDDDVNDNNINKNTTMIECLRYKSADDLLKASQVISNEGPTIDGEFILDHPHEVLLRGGMSSVDKSLVSDALDFFKSLDLISGVTNMDGTKNLFSLLTASFGTVDFENLTIDKHEFEHSLVPSLTDSIFKHQEVHHDHKPVDFKTFDNVVESVIFQYTNWTDPDNNVYRRNNALKLATHVDYAKPTLQIADAHVRQGENSSTFFYEFTHNPTFRFYNPSWVTGAGHGSELFFLFGFAPEMLHELGLTKHFVSEAEIRLSINMMKWISNFAKTGNPNEPESLSVQWPKYNSTDRPYLRLRTNMTSDDIRTRYGEPYTTFWLRLIPTFLMPEMAPPGGGWSPGDPDINGTHFSANYMKSRVSDAVFIALVTALCAFAIIIFFLVLSIWRHKKSEGS